MPSFNTQGGTTPGVTILNTDGTTHTAHTTAGFTEPVAGSHIYRFAHPAPGTLLEFIFDALIGGVTYYASVWDDGLTTIPARVGDAMTLTAAYDHAKDDVLTPLAEVDTAVDGIAADYARRTGDYNTVAPDNAGIAAAKAAAQSADGKLTSERLARIDTLYAATGTEPLLFRLLLDSDGDGHPDDPPVGVGGVTCHLLAHETATRIRESQTTDSQGYVYWHGLAAGTYDVDPDAAGYEGVTVAVTIPE